jgi:CRISPR/Cas system-associated protein endoribonuclease Cas2
MANKTRQKLISILFIYIQYSVYIYLVF